MSINPQRCREYAWHTEVTQEDISAVPETMLSNGEQLMLHWLARNMDLSGPGCIVDGGCFVGGSTVALASGIARNQSGMNDYRIHSYDIFIAPQHEYSLRLIGNGKQPGDTMLDIFAHNLRNLSRHVVVHGGDLLAAPPPQVPIDILFVDICKTRELNAKMVREFFPLLVPGRSIVVQQDHNDQVCPWVNATMRALSDHFDILCDDTSSRVYQCISAIPTEELERVSCMPLEEELRLLLELAEQDPSPFASFFTYVSATWTVLDKDGISAALTHLANIPMSQPWEGEPYLDQVRASIESAWSKREVQRISNSLDVRLTPK